LHSPIQFFHPVSESGAILLVFNYHKIPYLQDKRRVCQRWCKWMSIH